MAGETAARSEGFIGDHGATGPTLGAAVGGRASDGNGASTTTRRLKAHKHHVVGRFMGPSSIEVGSGRDLVASKEKWEKREYLGKASQLAGSVFTGCFRGTAE
jgi:hypothetical protein